MGCADFLLTQVGYIRKWVWGISALVFLAAVVGARVLSRNALWGISALTPLLALAAVCESGRSECYAMAELELATRFSLRSVVLARLIILGTQNALLLYLLLPFGLWHSELRPLAAGVYLLAPFLLTANLGLWAVRTIRGREGSYVCAGIALSVSASVLLNGSRMARIFRECCLPLWTAGVLALGVGLVWQYQKLLKRTEELEWN